MALCLSLKHFVNKKSVEEWTNIAITMGYETISDMLWDMRENRQMTYQDMAKMLGYNRDTISRKTSLVTGKQVEHGGYRRRPITTKHLQVTLPDGPRVRIGFDISDLKRQLFGELRCGRCRKTITKPGHLYTLKEARKISINHKCVPFVKTHFVLDHYVELLANQCVPGLPPDISRTGFTTPETRSKSLANRLQRRFGLNVLIDKKWTSELSIWIRDRSCLEILSGAGWIAKALKDNGVTVLATDASPCNIVCRNSDPKTVTGIQRMEPKTAVEKYSDCDVLVCSPSRMTYDQFLEACSAWGHNKPIVYIGKPFSYDTNGRNIKFDNCFKPVENVPDFSLEPWLFAKETKVRVVNRRDNPLFKELE